MSEHDWERLPWLLATDPPRPQWHCRKCGKVTSTFKDDEPPKDGCICEVFEERDVPRGDSDERVAQLEDELAATKRELKLVRGELTLTLNNWEQAKGKLRREKEELDARKRKLDERDKLTVEEIADERVGYWKDQCEKARAQCEEFRATLSDVCLLTDDIRNRVMS